MELSDSMEAALVIGAFVFLHLIGIFVYLPITFLKGLNPLLTTLLALWHVLLGLVNLGLAILCEIDHLTDLNFHEHVVTALWVCAAADWLFVWNFALVAYKSYDVKSKTVHHITAFTLFEFHNFIIFWVFLALMLSCGATDCSEFPKFQFLFQGLGAIFIAGAYFSMLAGALVYLNRLELYDETITRDEAVNIILKKINELPAIEWTVICYHKESPADDEHIVVKHTDTRKYIFNEYHFHTTTNSLGDISEDIFRRKLTKLDLEVSVKPKDKLVKEEMKESQKAFMNEHKGHDKMLKVKTKNLSQKKYLVMENENDRFKKTRFWVAAAVGMSLPYRWFLLFKIGHVKCSISKRVSSSDRPPSMSLSSVKSDLSETLENSDLGTYMMY